MNSKQTQAASNTLQANMKPVKESKPKADSTHQKKTTGIQKTSSKSSSAGTSALPAKAEKNPKDQSTK